MLFPHLPGIFTAVLRLVDSSAKVVVQAIAWYVHGRENCSILALPITVRRMPSFFMRASSVLPASPARLAWTRTRKYLSLIKTQKALAGNSARAFCQELLRGYWYWTYSGEGVRAITSAGVMMWWGLGRASYS